MPSSPPPRSSHFIPASAASSTSASSSSSSSANHGHTGHGARPSGNHPHNANYHHRPPPLPPPPRPAASLQPLSEQSLSFMFQVHMPDEEHGPYHPLAPGELPRLRTEIDTLLRGGRARTADLEREIASIDAWIATAQARSNPTGTRPPVSASSSQSAGKLVGMTSAGLPMPHRPRTTSSSSRPPLPPSLSLSAASSSSSLPSTPLSAAASLSAVAPPILSPRSAALSAASLPSSSPSSHGGGAGKNVGAYTIPAPLGSTSAPSSMSARMSMSPPPHVHVSSSSAAPSGSSIGNSKKRKYDHGSTGAATASGVPLSTNPAAASGSTSSATSAKPPASIKLKIKLGQPTTQTSTVLPAPHAAAGSYATTGSSSGGYIPPPPASTSGVVPPPQPYHTHPHIPPPTSASHASSASQPPPPKRKRLDKSSRASSVSSLPNASPVLSTLPAGSSFSHLPPKSSSASSAHRRPSLGIPHLHLPTDTTLYTGPTPVLPPAPPKGVTLITHVDRAYYHQNFVPDFDGVPAVEELQGADYSRPPPPNKVQNTPASTFWGYLDQWLRAVAEEDVVALGVAVPGAAAAAAAAIKAAKAKEATAARSAGPPGLLAAPVSAPGTTATGPDVIAQALAAFHAVHASSPVTTSAASAAAHAAATLAGMMEPGAYFGLPPDMLAGIDKTDLKYFLVPTLGAHPPANRPLAAHAAPPLPVALFAGGQGGTPTATVGPGAEAVAFDAGVNPTRPAVVPEGKIDKDWYAEQRAPPLLDRLLGALVPDPITQAAATASAPAAAAATQLPEGNDSMDVDETSEDEPGLVRVKQEKQSDDQKDVGLVSVPAIDPGLNPYAQAAAALFMGSVPASATATESTGAGKMVPMFAIEKLQERLLGELMALGIVKPGEPTPTGAAHADDQIASHLRATQHALRTQLAINRARKVRLMHLARQRLAYQEYRAVLDDVDRQLEAAYADRYLPKPPPKKGKKSKAGSAAAGGGAAIASGGKAASVRDASPALGGDASRGGSPAPGVVAGRPPVPAEVIQLIEKRKWLVKHVGSLFKEHADEYYESPSVSIYPDLPDNVGSDPKTGKLLVPKGPIPSGAWPPKVPRVSDSQQTKAASPQLPRAVGNKVKTEPGSVTSPVVLPGAPLRSPSPAFSRLSSTSPTTSSAFTRKRSMSGSITPRGGSGAASRHATASRSPSAMDVDDVEEMDDVDQADADADSMYEQDEHEDDDDDEDGSPLPMPAGRRRSSAIVASTLLASDGLESSPLPGKGERGAGRPQESPLREYRG